MSFAAYARTSTPRLLVHCTIAISIVHSKLDYCNSLYYSLPISLARAVVKSPKSCHITSILRTLHWLRITERIDYKLLSLTKF